VSMLGENVNWVQNVRAAGRRAVLCSGSREEVLYWLLGTSVCKIDNSNFHHSLIFPCHVILNHESNSGIFLRL
jgi:hypothetical protein